MILPLVAIGGLHPDRACSPFWAWPAGPRPRKTPPTTPCRTPSATCSSCPPPAPRNTRPSRPSTPSSSAPVTSWPLWSFLAGTTVFGLAPGGFALVNVFIALLWVVLAFFIGRRYSASLPGVGCVNSYMPRPHPAAGHPGCPQPSACGLPGCARKHGWVLAQGLPNRRQEQVRQSGE